MEQKHTSYMEKYVNINIIHVYLNVCTGHSYSMLYSIARITLVACKVQMFVSQGVEFSVFIHESRALTESKESQASLAYFEQDVT